MKPRTETFVLVLDQGDLLDTLQAHIDAYDSMEPGAEGEQELSDEIARLTAEVREGSIRGRFEKQPFLKWEAIKAQFPPRDGNEADTRWGFAVPEGFWGLIRACIVDPVKSDDEWAEIEQRVTMGDRLRLVTQVIELNQAETSIPKPLRPLLPTSPPGSGSKRRRGGASSRQSSTV